MGSHMRDLSVIPEVMQRLRSVSEEIELVMVVPPQIHSRFQGEPGIRCLSSLDDADLRSLYQSASCLLLPLEDGVACNALLEAMACGLPIVTTSVGANTDYLPREGAYLCEGSDPDGLADSVLDVLSYAQDERDRVGRHIRDHCIQFSLPVVAERLYHLFEGVR